MKNERIVLLNGDLTEAGGAERLTFEEARYLNENGFEPYVLTFDFREAVLFNQSYKLNIHVFNMKYNYKNLLIQAVYRITALRKKLREINPSVIIASCTVDCTYLYFATLFTPFRYATHIHGSIFWFPDDPVKYALIHRKRFNEIRNSVIGHREFIPQMPPQRSLAVRIIKEFAAVAMRTAIRKSMKIFVLSKQMGWEVGRLYDKDAVVLKGAFPGKILNYKPGQDIKKKLGLEDKRMILNLNRLDFRKRVDLLIKAFGKISRTYQDAVLVIGGIGRDEGRLKDLVSELDLKYRVRFVGFIREDELWDYYASCDIFVHPNWAEFAIAPYEVLALNKKVVWSTEMEIDETLKGNKHIFPADPNVDDFAAAIGKALITDVTEKNDMSGYTWDNYCKGVMRELNLPETKDIIK